MTGCDYKKCLRATSFTEPSQVPAAAGFRRGSIPSAALAQQAQPCAPAGTAGGSCPRTPRLPLMERGIVSAEQEAKQNLWIRILSTNTHKTSTVVTHKGEASFSFLSQ